MVTLQKNQLFDRWDTLPQSLRDAIFSEANSDFIWKLCGDENIPDEKIYDAAQVMGYVLLGFLHPEDASREIKEFLGIDAKTASIIGDGLNQRIFAPLRADIDKVYSPLSNAEATPTALSPKMLQDIGIPLKTAPAPAGSIMTPTPKTVSLSDIGWSKAPAPTGNIPPKPTQQMNTQVPHPAPIAGFNLTLTPVSTPTPAGPAPMILHEDTTFKPAEKNVGFTLSKPGASAEMNINQNKTQAPIRPAVLEFGTTPLPPKPQSSGPQTTHYTDFKPSLATMSAANAGPRNVSQITPAAMSVPIPKPPTAPKPIAPTTFATPIAQIPRIPTPPQPPTPLAQTPVTPALTPAPATAPQPNKPIVKDFL
jgi:hypothetical protein